MAMHHGRRGEAVEAVKRPELNAPAFLARRVERNQPKVWKENVDILAI